MRYFVAIFLCFAAIGGVAQVVISVDKQNILYVGLDNAITVAVAGGHKGEIDIRMDSAMVAHGLDGNQDIIRPGKLGVSELYVGWINAKGKKKTDSVRFRVKGIPDPVPFLAGKEGGSLQASIARVQIAPYAELLNFDIDAHFVVDSFTIIVIRDSKIILYKGLHNPNGTRFGDDAETEQVVKTLRAGDKLVFTDIYCYGYDHIHRHLQPMEFVLE